jgi:hypothetical protein
MYEGGGRNEGGKGEGGREGGTGRGRRDLVWALAGAVFPHGPTTRRLCLRPCPHILPSYWTRPLADMSHAVKEVPEYHGTWLSGVADAHFTG